MGFGGLHVGSLILILIIVILLFGTGRIRSIGKDIGQVIRDFRQSLEGDKKNSTEPTEEAPKQEKSEESKSQQSPKQE